VQAERSASVGTGSANAVVGIMPTRDPIMATPTSPLRILFMVLSFHLVRSRGTPATYGYVGDALSWDGGESCDCHHAFGDSVFPAKIHDDTQAASQTFIVDRGIVEMKPSE
jgi:hypothetical protein